MSLIGKILNQNKLLDGIISWIENQVGLQVFLCDLEFISVIEVIHAH